MSFKMENVQNGDCLERIKFNEKEFNFYSKKKKKTKPRKI